MMSSTSFRFSSIFFFFFILFIVAAIAEEYSNIPEEDSTNTYLQAGKCMYVISVHTGTVTSAGTDSHISLKLSNGLGSSLTIQNLKDWGVMEPGNDYFENGNLDFFVVNGACLLSKVCRITVTSDGTGTQPGWYLEYVDIITIGPNIPTAQIMFPVNQWLATSSAPFQLSTTRDKCRVSEGAGEEGRDIAKVNTDFVVRTWE